MSDSTTNIPQVVAAANADVRVNELIDAASPALLYGRNAATSGGLTWGYLGGRFKSAVIANGTLALTASTTSYITAARSTGVVSASASTTDWNDPACIRLYMVVTGGASVSSYQDHRDLYNQGGGGSSVPSPLVENVQTGNYTAVLSDAERWVIMNVAAGNSFTVPPDSSVAFANGTSILVTQEGAGVTTLVAGAGVTIKVCAPATLLLRGQNAQAVLTKRSTNLWYASGDLA